MTDTADRNPPAMPPGRELDAECTVCCGCGYVCEDHERYPWGGVSAHLRACNCGGAGMCCRACGGSGRAALKATTSAHEGAEAQHGK